MAPTITSAMIISNEHLPLNNKRSTSSSSPSETMAPTCMPSADYSKLSNKEKHKLRKPVVEKMRRDRINSCIEQLKGMLEKEFHQQDPNTKLEKADILEMTVIFLKQQLQSQISAPQKAHRDGYSQCWRETVNFLSANSKLDVTLQHLNSCQEAQRAQKDFPVSPRSSQAPVKQEISVNRAVWRPW
ncbi:hairy and enhancer of split-related 15, tandem duplicate 1 [Silurus meridionalis]|nr:hairy and enhancer of split-related 15, tandem duplicate 1 [Silurus meridionalis]